MRVKRPHASTLKLLPDMERYNNLGMGTRMIGRIVGVSENTVLRALKWAGLYTPRPFNGSHRREDTCHCGAPAEKPGAMCKQHKNQRLNEASLRYYYKNKRKKKKNVV